MPTIPDREPTSLRVGDTWRWTRSLSDYPAPTWVLKYRFKNAAGGFEITASASGSDHSITVAAATSAGYTAGNLSWIAWVEGGSSEKYTVAEGTCQLLRDLRTGTATAALDDRSDARKALDAITTWITSRDLAVADYQIAGRSMKFIPITELIKLQDRFTRQVANEEQAQRVAAGLGRKNKLLVRFK